jgi:hypothetical protein
MTSTAGTASFGLNDSPNVALTTPAVGTQYRYRAWVRSASGTGTAKLQVREFQGSTGLTGLIRSNGVVLSPSWQLLTLDFTCVGSGSTIDFQIVDFPLIAGETFQVDDISVYNLSSTVGVGDVLTGLEPMRPRLAPSPLHTQSSLTFLTTKSGRLEVGLFDLSGRRVRELLNDSESFAGVHRLTIDGRGEHGEALPSGMYFYRVQAVEGAVSGRFIIAR